MSSIPPRLVHAEGKNYRIERVGRLILAEVWKRADLDSNEGAKLAEEVELVLRSLAGAKRSLVLDLRRAPEVNGPRTQTALGRIVQAWSAASCRVAFITPDSAVGQLQLKRIAETYGTDNVRLFQVADEALGWTTTA
jgi:hypothetical protein